MRSRLLLAALLMLGACPKGNKPASPVSRDGGETDIVRTCQAMHSKVEGLYQKEADREGIAPNLRSEFVEANLHMVMRDCRQRPALGYACLQRSRSVAELEADCLIFLDDEGTVEGFRFASGGS